MTDLKAYLRNIPDGIIRELIGSDICDSITAYNEFRDIEDSSDYADIIMHRFGQKILLNTKNSVLRNIILFMDDSLIRQIQTPLGILIDDTEETRKKLITKIKRANSEPFLRELFIALDLDADFYLHKSEEFANEIETSVSPKYQLHDFQKNVKDRSISYLLNIEKSNKQLIHLPTGAGKTKTGVEIICDYLRSSAVFGGFNKSTTVVWFAHNNELCEQAMDTFVNTWRLRGDIEIEVIPLYGDHGYEPFNHEARYKIYFAGLPKFVSLMKSRKDDQKELAGNLREHANLVFIDEAHKSLATTWNRAIKFLADGPGCQLVGLTATPGRTADIGEAENLHLAEFFRSEKIGMVDDHGCAINKPLAYLQSRGFLAEIVKEEVLTQVEISISDEEMANISRYGDSRLKGILQDLSKHPKRNSLLVEKIRDHFYQGKKILIFSCSVDHSYTIQALLNTLDIRSECVDGETPKDQRTSFIEEFREHELQVLINFGVLSTGFDAPKLNTLIIARPTSSIVLYSQMIGRALRGPKNNGNRENTLITLRDNINIGGEQKIFGYFDEIWR